MNDVSEMSLSEVEDAIESTYKWWHREKPGVHPREVGQLAALWRRCDYLLRKEQ